MKRYIHKIFFTERMVFMKEQDMKELDINELDNVAGGWKGIDKGDLIEITMKSNEFNKQSTDRIINILSNFEGGALETINCDQNYDTIHVLAKLRKDKSSVYSLTDVLKAYLAQNRFTNISITLHD